MKKFLSVLLAVMMVLSTVSFAAPSAFTGFDAAFEAPVAEEVEDANLAFSFDEPYSFSLEFDTANDLTKIATRGAASTNALGANCLAVKDGALVVTFDSKNKNYVQDLGLTLSNVSAPAGAVTALEMRVKVSGMPADGTVIPDTTRVYKKDAFNLFQFYPTTNGSLLVSDPQWFNFAIKENEWVVYRFTAEQLMINDLTGFRLDFNDYMPHGATVAIDYIRFYGNEYDTLNKYDIEFDNADELARVRIQQNLAVSSYYWNEAGYLTLKAVANEGNTATWDHQVYLNDVGIGNALEAGIVDKIIVKMRYRNIPSSDTEYIVKGKEDKNTGANPKFVVTRAPHYVFADAADSTKWTEKLTQNCDRFNLVEGEWVIREFDAAKYFPAGISNFRIDSTYPIPNGAEIDIDYIRFVGDNSKVKKSDWEGKYGELVLEVNFENLPTGVPGVKFPNDMKVGGTSTENGSNFISKWGSKVNPAFDASKKEIYFRNETGNADLVIKEDATHGKYVEFTITEDGKTKTVWDLNVYNNQNAFSQKDGYFVLTYDFFSPREGLTIQTHWNRTHEAEDIVRAEGKQALAKANEWTNMVEIYDASSIGTSTHNPPIASINEINHILLYSVGQSVGETYAIDNLRLWWVPKSVKVEVNDGDAGLFAPITMTVNPLTKVSDFIASIPEFAPYTVKGISLTKGGELLDNDAVLGFTYPTTVYCEWEKMNTLDYSIEFNSDADIAKIKAQQARVGSNNSLTVDEQFVLASDGTSTYLKMDVKPASGDDGCVVDFGFLVTTTEFSSADVREIAVKMRVKGLPSVATGFKCAGHGTCAAGTPHTIDPANCNYAEIVWWNAEKNSVKQDYLRANLKGNEDWFIYSIKAEDFWKDPCGQLRFDPFGDYAPAGATVEIDYIRFYGYDAKEPTTYEDKEVRISDDTYGNGIRFKASIDNITNTSSVDIGWAIALASKHTGSYNELTVENAAKVAYQREAGVDKARFFDTSIDNVNVFSAVLYNIPAEKCFEYIIMRPFVKVGEKYYYGNGEAACLYDIAVRPYLDLQDEDEIFEWYSFDDVYYADEYNDLDVAQIEYFESILEVIFEMNA